MRYRNRIFAAAGLLMLAVALFLLGEEDGR